MSTKTKNTKNTDSKQQEQAPETAPVANDEITLSKEQQDNLWTAKHPQCSGCGCTDRKRYSGGLCTKCYTEMRNAKLGLGLYNKETQARKVERMDARIQKLEQELQELKAQRKNIVARVA